MSESMPERTVHLTEYFQVVWRRRLLVLFIWLLIFGAATLYTFMQKPMYKIESRVLIERQVQLPSDLGIASGEPSKEFYQTQYLLIRSRDVARKLYADMQMDTWPVFQQLKSRDKYEVVRNWIRITPIRDSHMVYVWILWPERIQGARMVNRITDFYLEGVRRRRQRASLRAAEGLANRVTLLEGNIADIQTRVRAYRQTYGLYSEREQISFLLGRMSQAITQFAVVRGELIAAEAESAAVQAAVERGEDIVPEMNLDYLENLRTRLQMVEENWEITNKTRTKAMLEKDLADSVYMAQKTSIQKAVAVEQARLQAQRLSEINRRLTEAKTNFDRLQAELTVIEPQVKEYQFRQFELMAMEEQQELLRGIVDALKKGEETIRVERAVEETFAYVDEPAEPPVENDYFTPRYFINIPLGLFVGLMVGITGAFFAEYLNTTIRLPSDIQQSLNLPLLGFVPAIPASIKSFANRGKIAHLAGSSGPAEAYRSLRTELLLSSSPNQVCGTVMITSTNPREGKTTVATNLAITMAQAGYRALLIDADLRKPMTHEVFGLDNEHGLSTLLSQTGEARVYIKKTEIENLHVLPGGPVPINPAELLGSRKMRTLVADAAERYDVVIIDSSPVLGVADANILATMVDAVILVIQASKAKRGHVIRARDQLLGVNARLAGVVLNNVRGSRGDYYYYRRYYNPAQIRGMAESVKM